MTKFSKEHIEHLLGEAPAIAPELINEFYEALEEGGYEAVNTLFATKGTFNPEFKSRTDVIGYIVTMKQFSGIMLTPEEKAVQEKYKK